jgi:inorganic triphosphatase YgiF
MRRFKESTSRCVEGASMTSAATGRELEFKLELTQQELKRVDAHPALRNLTVGQPITQVLHTIYFDTPDHRLRSEGISLRLRSDGNGWLQTVKAGTEVANSVSPAVEPVFAATEPSPDMRAIKNTGLRRRIVKAVKGSPLEPVFETIITRTTRHLHCDKADMKLVLDEGVVRSGKEANALCEAELELKAGAADCLLETATKLFSAEPVRLARISKAERGYDLALGRKDGGAVPTGADHVRLQASATCAEALALFLQSATAQIVVNRVAVLETDAPEAAHQLRIGLRRLRSALGAFRPLNDTPLMRQMETHACALARVVGGLRDADILIDDIYASVAGLIKGHSGLPPLRKALLAHRAQKREEVRSALSGMPWSAFQLYLALAPCTIEESKSLDQPLAALARSALGKGWKKVAKFGKHLDDLDGDRRHEMRKSLKKLRYTLEFFGSLYKAKEVGQFVKDLRKLQDVFGYVNDVVTASQLNAISEERCRDSQEAQRAAGYVLGWHNAEAQHRWKAASRAWRDLKRNSEFWR